MYSGPTHAAIRSLKHDMTDAFSCMEDLKDILGEQKIVMFRRLLFYFLVYGSAYVFVLFFQKRKKNYRLFIFILSSDVTILASLILKQAVQGLQAFAFCILAINNEHPKQT